MKRLIICVLLPLSAIAQSTWQMVGLDGGGSMYSIAGSPHDPDVMMISSDMSGAFISRDRGRSWKMINHGQVRGNTKCRPLFDPDVRNRIYFPKSSGSSILCRSDDAGVSWTPILGTPWRKPIVYIGVVDGELTVGAGDAVYHRPTDRRSWTRYQGVTGRCFSICKNHGTVIVGTTDGVFRSSGDKYQKVTGGAELATLTGFTGNRSHLYLTTPSRLVSGQLVGGVYHSANGGSTWKHITSSKLNVQTKRSSQWANSDLPQYKFPMTTNKAPKQVYVYCSGTSYYPPNHSTIYRSDDAGGRWRAVWFSDPRFGKLYNVEEDRLTLGVGQRYQYPPIDVSINPGNPQVLMMSTDMMGFFTYDGGTRWHVSQDPKPVQKGRRLFCRPGGLGVTSTWHYKIDPHDPTRHYICYTDIGFARSFDTGKSWTWDGPKLPWKNTVYDLAFDPDRKGKIWGAFSQIHDIPNYNVIGGKHRVKMAGGVGVTNDSGDSWKPLSLPKAPCLSVVLDPTSPTRTRTLYASLFERGVFTSTDDGQSWKPLPTQPGTPANRRVCKLLLHNDGTLFCLVTAKRIANVYDGVGPGLYHTTDRGASWTKTTSGLTVHWPKDFDVNPNDSGDVLLGAAKIKKHSEAGLYRTRNKGNDWTRIAAFESEHFGGYFHPTHKGWIYATCTEGAKTSGLYLSRDDGKSWTAFKSLPFSNVHRVHFDPDLPDQIILTTFGASILKGPATPREGNGRKIK